MLMYLIHIQLSRLFNAVLCCVLCSVVLTEILTYLVGSPASRVINFSWNLSLTELNFCMNLSFSREFTGIKLKHFVLHSTSCP